MSSWRTAQGPENDVVLSTRIRLARNVRGIPFPAKMGIRERHALTEKVKVILADPNSVLFREFHFVDMAELTLTQAVALVERNEVSADFIADRDGRALLITEDESSSVMVNEEDHFILQTFGSGLALKETYEKADRLDTVLNKALGFAFDRKLGYLTQNPMHLGTGMIASAFLHLPALSDSGATGRLASNLSKLGISLRGAYGYASKQHGAMFQLSNQVTLGLSEQEAVSNLTVMARQIAAQERDAREKLMENLGVQDTVWRSLGILKNARLLSGEEFSDLISIVRFGVAGGLIQGVSLEEIAALMMRSQPATLAEESRKPLTVEERRAFRAQIAREVLGGAGCG